MTAYLVVMKPSIDNVRELASKNAMLLRGAHDAHENILASADAECDRLSKLIDGVSAADVLQDENKAEMYQAWVTHRAQLQRILSERHG